jgi:uncharacterized protein YfaS (alpha-2-macroglobulin family)
VADAVTGKPLEKAHLEFFVSETSTSRTTSISPHQPFANTPMPMARSSPTRSSSTTSTNGRHRAPEGRFAYPLEGVWYGRTEDYEYNAVKVFTITDRPVYRPNNKVKYKFWVRSAKYDMEDVSDREQALSVQIN